MKSWGVYIAAVLGFFIYGAATKVDRDGTGAIVDGGSVGAFDIRVGDCFDDATITDDEISNVPGVPCADPHDNEAYAVFDITAETYPGGDGMWELASSSCIEHFEAFVGKDYESSSLDIFPIYPSPQSWQENDREVICAVFDVNSSKLVGSAEGRNL